MCLQILGLIEGLFVWIFIPRTKCTYINTSMLCHWRLIPSMWQDCTKDIQSVKPAWSICIQSLKPTPYPFSRRIMKDAKMKHTVYTVQETNFPLRISSVYVTKSTWMQIWSHLLKKSLMENFIFCAVLVVSHHPFRHWSKGLIR